MALHAGEISFDENGFTGKPIILAARLLGAEPVRAALRASSGALVLVVSQWFYDEVVSQSGTVDPATYRPVEVRVKETAVTGWVGRPDNPYPPRRAGNRGRGAVAACVAGVLVLAAALTADTRFVPGPRLGEELPAEGEFVAKVVNQRSHKCISRNGAYSQKDEADAERVGEDVYQWECPGPATEPGHTVVLAPLASGWAIRSSIRPDLCLAADGAPGLGQRYQSCAPQDDRQRWRLRRVLGPAAGLVVLENDNTKMCLAFTDPDPTDINLAQTGCTPSSATEWEIRRYPGIGATACAGNSRLRLRNHETRRYADGELTPAAAGRTAHGCATVFTDASGRCLGPAGASARMLPCGGGPDQRWIVEPMGTEGGLAWARIHTLANLSRCLQPEGPSMTVRRCGTSWLQQWHLG